MGARQRAQKRTKLPNKASRGSLKGSPASQKKGNSSLYVSDLNPAARSNALIGWQDDPADSPSFNRNGFSMTDQARNTERHVFGWGATKLREQTISFVSAGKLRQDDIDEQAHVQDKENADTPDTSEEDQNVEQEQSDLNNVVEEEEPLPAATAEEVTVEESAPQIVLNDHTRPRSHSSSSSESEQIVFKGRHATSQTPSAPVSRNRSIARPVTVEDVVEEEAPKKDVPVTQPISIAMPTRTHPSAVDSSLSDRRHLNNRLRRRGRARRKEVSDEEEAIMQDYIANMAMDDSEEEDHKTSMPIRKNEHFRYYDGAGEENMKVQIQSIGASTPASMPSIRGLGQAMDWNSEDLEDFDDFDTTDEEIFDISQVLRQRHRPSGLQYLVTPMGRETSDAKWLLRTKMISESAHNELRIFEEIQAMEFDEGSFSDDSSSDEDEEALNDLIDHIESEDDENTKIMQHTSRMTDEQIARALAKQEELGLGSDELVLFNGDIGDDDEEDMDAFGRNDDFVSFSLKQHTSNRGRSKRNKKQKDSFPSAGAFADALDEDPYGAFDVMDFDRPSLRPKKKGRKSDFPYDLELPDDDDLKDQLVSTWMRDREKKASRKREKEEARLSAVFDASERNEPSAIRAEIRRFLVQEIDALRLAPMDSSTRASVHRLAKALKLNSHSEGKEGKGAGRFPVLTKTARTPVYTIDNIWEIDALLNTRKFFPKHAGSFKAPKIPRGSVARMRRSGGVQGASPMNGEVVGASAPELSADNKGRLLLEKMGWTTGMGIGAVGNKGSLEAIKHVVKTTKAGLG